MPVDTPRAEYVDKLPQWERCRTCYDGQDAVKAGGEKFLPKLDSHRGRKGDEKYKSFKDRAFFFNATGRTVNGLSGAVFQKQMSTELPDRVTADIKDVTLTNESLEMFALKATKEIMKVGRYGVLVDMAMKELKPTRPYWVPYRAEDIISWRTTRRGGDEVLTLVVLREFNEVANPDDEFVTALHERYRVLRLRDQVYEQVIYEPRDRSKKDKIEWVITNTLVIERRGTPLNFIPFVFLNATSVGPTVEPPPLLDLVDTNISHYHTLADLEHGRHFCGLPQPWLSGATASDDKEPLTIGSGVAWELSEKGRAGMLEFTGQGLGALEKADRDKREMMAAQGARLIESQSRVQEAKETVEMRHSGEHASLRTIAASVEQGLTLACQWHAWWIGTEAIPNDVKASVELNKDFFSIDVSPEKVRTALMAVQAGELSGEAFFDVLHRGSWIRESTTWEEEQARRQAEGRARTKPSGDPDDDPDDDIDEDESGKRTPEERQTPPPSE